MDTVHEGALASAGVRADGTIDINAALRSMLEGLLNAVMDEQASELGVARNGYRERRLDTCVGTVTLRIPKLREGSYFPDDIVQRWSRTDTALASAICDMWVSGVSTRKVERVAAEMGVERMSRGRVSRLCASLDEEVSELRGCDLSGSEWPYLWLDATYVPCREAGAARSTALVTAVACDLSATRRVVGVERVDAESYRSWRDFLLSLRRRGLSGVRLVVSDAHEGLVRAVREVLTGASWQRCVAHLERNVMERCRRKGDGAGAVAALRAAFAESDPALVRAGYRRACELLAERDPSGAGLLEDAEADALCYLDFPREHRVWIRTNNVQERMNGEIKRRTRVVQVFPSPESLVRLVGAVCCDQNDAWLAATNFMDPRTLAEGYEREPLPAEPGGEERVLRLVREAFDRKARAA
ncbi:MAG: IS256 family transposase [Parafannyhessea umbonata]|jgi:transposase-like protein|uniref:IS256 family transposase n=1 Tax=Parafannyhessea umbonata TaxID=604330 RepID=UPI0026ECA902|nr:IS256 family transposase [Parafannyhessea umbonata]MDD6565698.1 IS256 family transposase [Parafannyhessea umbonata]